MTRPFSDLRRQMTPERRERNRVEAAKMLEAIPDSRRRLSTLTADEWVRTLWVEVTNNDDGERMFVSAGLRTPNEAASERGNVDAIGWDEYRTRG